MLYKIKLFIFKINKIRIIDNDEFIKNILNVRIELKKLFLINKIEIKNKKNSEIIHIENQLFIDKNEINILKINKVKKIK